MNPCTVNGKRVFALRFPRFSGSQTVQSPASVVSPHWIKSDLIIPLCCAGTGRIQTSQFLAANLMSQLGGRFTAVAELWDSFGDAATIRCSRLLVAEKARAILSGSSFGRSAAGAAALMGLHPKGRWRQSDVPLLVSENDALGLYLHVDVERSEQIPAEVERCGIRMHDDSQAEYPLKFSLAVLQAQEGASSGKGNHNRRQFCRALSGAQLRTVLEWAIEADHLVATGVTSMRVKRPGEATKVERFSDLSVLQPGEVRSILKGNGFVSFAGIAVDLALLDS